MRQCSVVIPAYHPDPEALNRALAMLLLMPLAAHIIVVDDGSEPALRDDQGPLGAKRVTLIRQPNAGVSSARNAGIEHALRHNTPVLFLDADDEPLPGIADALDLLCVHSAGGVISAREERTPAGASSLKAAPPEWASKALPKPADVFRPVALFGASGLLVSHEALANGLRFDPALTHAEDRDFLRHLADQHPIIVNPQPALRVALHEEGAANLTSAAHDVKRAASMRTLVDRWHDADSDPHFRASARWLISRIAKRRSPDEAWRTMVALHKQHSWPIPLKTRLRRLLKPAAS